MESRSQRQLKVVPLKRKAAAKDDLAIARLRMRHLAPWHVEPLPMMHSAIGGPAEPVRAERREHNAEFAPQLLAMHMWLATARSAMQ